MTSRMLNTVKLKRVFQMLSASTPQREICVLIFEHEHCIFKIIT